MDSRSFVRYAAIAGGFFCVAAGLALTLASGDNLLIKLLGLSMMVGSQAIFRRASPKSERPTNDNLIVAYYRLKLRAFKKKKTLGIGVIVNMVAALYAIHLDAVNGYNSVFPVFYFAIAGIIVMAYWIYLSYVGQEHP